MLATTARQPAVAPTADARQGRILYTKYGCYQCHGFEGQGSASAGPRLGPDPIAFPMFVRFTREPRDQMPPYTAKVLTDQEIDRRHLRLRGVAASSAGG
jgi:ubiquinol-cytochrome c reductase cytochrome c subunit